MLVKYLFIFLFSHSDDSYSNSIPYQPMISKFTRAIVWIRTLFQGDEQCIEPGLGETVENAEIQNWGEEWSGDNMDHTFIFSKQFPTLEEQTSS